MAGAEVTRRTRLARAAAAGLATVLWLGGALAGTAGAQTDGSLRFYGTGADDIDRVKIRIDDPPSPVDVGGDLTIEVWLRAEPGSPTSGDCRASDEAGDTWINGNIVLDRDVFNEGDFGDYGLSLYGGNGGTIAFGVAVGGDGVTLCGGENLADGQWHHIAVTRAEAGPVALFVDGRLVAQGDGPAGDISYRDGRDTDYPNSDPYLVLGAEKHDAGSDYPSFNGWLDELRISSTIRYTAEFEVPTVPFEPDSDTVALYHMDEGGGTVLVDASGNGADGEVRQGGPAGGPTWDVGVFATITPTTTTATTAAPADGTTTSAAPTTEAPTTSAAPTTEPTDTTSATSAGAAAGTSDDGGGSGSAAPWLISGAVVLAAGAGVAVWLTSRRTSRAAS